MRHPPVPFQYVPQQPCAVSWRHALGAVALVIVTIYIAGLTFSSTDRAAPSEGLHLQPARPPDSIPRNSSAFRAALGELGAELAAQKRLSLQLLHAVETLTAEISAQRSAAREQHAKTSESLASLLSAQSLAAAAQANTSAAHANAVAAQLPGASAEARAPSKPPSSSPPISAGNATEQQSAQAAARERSVAVAPFVFPQLYQCRDPAAVARAALSPPELHRDFRASQSNEDAYLYQHIFRGANITGRTFIEIGALDGVMLSNTLAFETAFDWRGILIEGHPTNSVKLRSAGGVSGKRPRSAVFTTAICGLTERPGGRVAPGTVKFTSLGGPIGAVRDSASQVFLDAFHTKDSGASPLSVDCVPMQVRWYARCNCGDDMLLSVLHVTAHVEVALVPVVNRVFFRLILVHVCVIFMPVVPTPAALD